MESILILEAPPRHGKSEFVSRYLPAWYLGRYPDKRVILTSYGAEFARSWGRKARDLLIDYGDWFGVRVSEAQSAAVDWELAKTGGGMVTAGVGGPITGRGANLLIVDDFLKNDEEAMSETIRDKHWDWWLSTAMTRLEPGGKIVCMATRWHKDDLIGRILRAAEEGEGEPVRRISLPALCEGADDPLGRAIGEPLWPRRWPLAALEKRRTALGSYWWNALYQQRPTQHGDAEFPSRCFGDGIWAVNWPDKFEMSVLCLDPSKGKDAKRGDYSATVFGGLCGGKVYVDCHLQRGRSPSGVVSDAIEMANRYQPMAVGVETNQFQELLLPEFDRQCQEQRRPPLPLISIENHVNKLVRIRRIGPHLERDLFRFHPRCKLLVQQLREFPLADHDDGPDGLEMVMRLFSQLLANQNQSEPEYEFAEV